MELKKSEWQCLVKRYAPAALESLSADTVALGLQRSVVAQDYKKIASDLAFLKERGLTRESSEPFRLALDALEKAQAESDLQLRDAIANNSLKVAQKRLEESRPWHLKETHAFWASCVEVMQAVDSMSSHLLTPGGEHQFEASADSVAALLAFETSTDTFYKTSAPASNERARAASEALADGIVKREGVAYRCGFNPLLNR